MKRIKIIGLVLFIVAIAIQFFKPALNQNGQVNKNSITKIVQVPQKVQMILSVACYDCHSNNTRYPWYANIQPGGWWLASHIKEGKSQLNFDEFGSYSNRRQQSKLKSIINSIDDGTMPLSSYTLIHKDAILSKEDK
ncbi:MAG: heme-binding domain-containing protein, partial [Ferruginibacter sp.]|nr:heme-binding domain-containing protein [Ferruginibacter sp.]